MYHQQPITATAVPVTPLQVPLEGLANGNGDASFIDQPATQLSEEQLERLLEQGFTRGLSLSLNQMKQVFALRIWVIDNSGSMQKTDGHRIVSTAKAGDVRMVSCSRWEEIQACVDYHIKLAGLIGAPTKFRLLNDPGAHIGPQQFSVAVDPNRKNKDVQEALGIVRRARPGGCTPLTSHILEIYNDILHMAPLLRRLGKKVAVVIATDGLPTDERGYGGPQHSQEFVEALRSLEGLPVWVVIRLCTDEDEVVDFYNNLDGQLELSLEVLDDFTAEAKEVYEFQPWLSYGLPLHRLREFGFHDRVFDMLDERPLTKSEILDFCRLLFGEERFDGVADPNLNWESFLADVERLLRSERKTYDPLKRHASSWISTKKLNAAYNPSGCIII